MKFLLTLIVVLWGGSSALASQYKLDAAHTNLGFKVRHLAFANVRGQFKKFSGEGEYDEKSGKIKRLSVSIESSSVDTNEPDRDKHLRSKDFFFSTKHPKILFKSKKIDYSGKTPKKIHGDLTLRGLTKPVTLTVNEWGGTATDAWGNERLAFEASGKFDRRDFGLVWNKGLAKIGGLTVGNDVKLELEVQGMKVEKKKKKSRF